MQSQSSANALTEHPPEYTALERRALKLFEEGAHLIRGVASDAYEVPSSAGGMLGKRYRVRYGGSAEEGCSCPAWTYGDGRACKHLLCLGIMHATRRGGVREVRAVAAVAGDPFKHAAARRGCSLCFGGYITMTIEEDSEEHDVAVPCRRCNRGEA
jgi:hypothetical protein